VPDEPPKTTEVNGQPKATDAIPRGLTAAAEYAFGLDFLVHFVLGLISIALGTWYALSRPGIAVLVVAVALAGYVVVHLWRHLTEHPRRDPNYRRRRRARPES
jgi:hypothetical protein